MKNDNRMVIDPGCFGGEAFYITVVDDYRFRTVADPVLCGDEIDTPRGRRLVIGKVAHGGRLNLLLAPVDSPYVDRKAFLDNADGQFSSNCNSTPNTLLGRPFKTLVFSPSPAIDPVRYGTLGKYIGPAKDSGSNS